MEEVHEPALPTEGVQLDLGLHYPPQVSGMVRYISASDVMLCI